MSVVHATARYMTFDFDLEKFTKVTIFETSRKTSQNMLGYYAQGIIYCWLQRSKSWLIKRSNLINWL